jgi:hypothetical protein
MNTAPRDEPVKGFRLGLVPVASLDELMKVARQIPTYAHGRSSNRLS